MTFVAFLPIKFPFIVLDHLLLILQSKDVNAVKDEFPFAKFFENAPQVRFLHLELQ